MMQVCALFGISLLLERAGRFAPAPRPGGKVPLPSARANAPPGGARLMETGKDIQESRTVPIGDRVGFFADAGHSLR